MKQIRLAPLCGVTDHIFREICYSMGCDLAYTEMISAMGYLCAPGQRATADLMIRGQNEPHLILQLFGRDPDIVAEAASRIDRMGIYDGIDLNMGCPAKKIAPSGEGCGLMRTPEIAGRMIEKTVKAVKVPVSVKMRLGYDKDHRNAVQIAKIAENAGVSEITVHGRTREQQYSGRADWDAIGEVKQAVSCPVIGNGDLFTADEAVEKMTQYSVDGVMIGRGAMGNPWIFRQIRQRLRGEKVTDVSIDERREMIIRHFDAMLMEKPEKIAVREMRKHIGWYLHGLRGASRTRAEINRCPNAQQVFALLDSYFSTTACDDERRDDQTEEKT